MPIGIAVGVGAAAGLAGNIIGANAQTNAANQANATEQNEFNTINQNEQPFLQAGQNGTSLLQQYLGTSADDGSAGQGNYGSLLQPFTAQNFQQLSPAYNFQAQQGRQGVLNADSSGAGALSGAAQKDLISYNQSMANTSFNNAFNQYQTQQGNIYSRLAGLANLGQSAASQQAQSGTAIAGQQGANAISAGNAIAGAATGSAATLGNSALAYQLAGNSGGFGGFGGGGGGVTSSFGPSTTAGGASGQIGDYGTI